MLRRTVLQQTTGNLFLFTYSTGFGTVDYVCLLGNISRLPSRMAWMHWCTTSTSLPWGKTKALTTSWIDVSSSCRDFPLMFSFSMSLHVVYSFYLCLQTIFHMGITLDWEKRAVFGSLALCGLGHNRCLLLSAPNKGAFINCWWPTCCLSWWLLFYTTSSHWVTP